MNNSTESLDQIGSAVDHAVNLNNSLHDVLTAPPRNTPAVDRSDSGGTGRRSKFVQKYRNRQNGKSRVIPPQLNVSLAGDHSILAHGQNAQGISTSIRTTCVIFGF